MTTTSVQCDKCDCFLEEESLEDRKILVWTCPTCGRKVLWLTKEYQAASPRNYHGGLIILMGGSKSHLPDIPEDE